jgi:hypothetical protein
MKRLNGLPRVVNSVLGFNTFDQGNLLGPRRKRRWMLPLATLLPTAGTGHDWTYEYRLCHSAKSPTRKQLSDDQYIG